MYARHKRAHAKDVESLLQQIREGIARRGFFILLDERVALIPGFDGKPRDDFTANMTAIKRFAIKQDWFAHVQPQSVTFWVPGKEPFR